MFGTHCQIHDRAGQDFEKAASYYGKEKKEI